MIGETIGNFRIVSRLGRGGMGEVYLAEQQNIGTRVAVKLLLPSISADEEHVKRFFNEARAVQRIQHAGIVKIFDVGFHPSGHAYLVMEYLEGESLAQRIRRVGALHPAEIAELGRQIASVLDATHTAGITHRDLKPDNIYIVADRELASRQRAKVLDFGIAKLSGTLAGASPQTIGTMGTPAYMAPEQWGDASKVDWRADIYSLGCLAFEMACGCPPFVVTTIAEACGKHLTETPPRASSLAPGVPPELDQLIDDMLAKKPAERPQSMELVTQRFAELAQITGPAPASSALPPGSIAPPAGVLAAGTPAHPNANPYGDTMATDAGVAATVPTGRNVATPVSGFDATVATGSGAIEPRPTGPIPRPPPSARRSDPSVLDGGKPPRVVPESPTRRRWPLVVALLAIAGAGGAIAYVTTRPSKTVTPPAEEPCTVSPPPVLDGTSADPVLLRYSFQPGQATEVTLITQAKTDSTTNGNRTADDLRLTLEGEVSWQSADNDRFTGMLKLTKISADRTTATGPVGSEDRGTTHWRSDDPSMPARELGVLNHLIGVGIPLQIGARGDIHVSGFPEIQKALGKEHAVPIVVAAFARDEVLRTVFPRLPDKPVKIGDSWRGGDVLRKTQYGDISARMELRVKAISADGKQVLIEATPDLRVDLAGTVTLTSKQTAFALWSQFDVERHDVTASAMKACVKLSLDGPAKTEVAAMLEATYDPRPLGVTPPPAPPKAPPDAAVAAVTSPDAAVTPDAAEPPPTEPPPTGALAPMIAKALERKRDELRACVGPGGGRATLSLTIAPNGVITRAPARGLEPVANRCLTTVVRGTQIARTAGGPSFEVEYPIVFPPEGKVGGTTDPVEPIGDGTLGLDGTPALPDVTPRLLETMHSADDKVLACGDATPGSAQSWVRVVIAPDGSVGSATAKAEPEALRTCIEDVVKKLQFRASKRGRTTDFGYKVR